MRAIVCSMAAVAAAHRIITDSLVSLHAETSLKECLDIASFKKESVDDDGTTTYAGQCEPSSTPGAYYTGDGKLPWQCWGDQTVHSVRNDASAKTQGFVGACTFSDSQSKKLAKDIGVCPSVGFEDCVTNEELYWGACYTPGSTPTCILKTESKKAGYVNGDCKGLASRDHPDSLYTSVCRIVAADVKTYKCETIGVYSAADAATCGGQREGEPKPYSACYSLEKDVTWQCHAKKEDSIKATTCVGISSPKGHGDRYNGGCLFKDATGYEEAVTWVLTQELIEETTTTTTITTTITTTTTTTITITKSAAARSASIAIAALGATVMAMWW